MYLNVAVLDLRTDSTIKRYSKSLLFLVGICLFFITIICWCIKCLFFFVNICYAAL